MRGSRTLELKNKLQATGAEKLHFLASDSIEIVLSYMDNYNLSADDWN
jgi:antitoxin component HigA of HigAB toxin-antitoxin module